MTETTRGRWILCAVLAIAGVVFLLGISWGLPSKSVDPYLFGDEPVWPGAKIAELAPSDAGVLGADVDADPIFARDRAIVLNATDRGRAEIIRRFRLFSYKPDEMITFRSLSRIKQNHGDPRLYQYGGLWVYPVGAMLQLASAVELVDLRGDQAYYLDHPEAFGRFYLVARLYSAAWGLVAVAAVFWILRGLGGGIVIPAVGAVCFALMPVVITMAHEAKPHLPGLALTLLAVLAATKYVETGRRWCAMLAGALCGAAMGMVLSGLLAFAILLMMLALRRGSVRARLAALVQATTIGLVVYAMTNPFVLINAFRNPEILRSNLGNSTAMYAMSLGGVANAITLVAAGASPLVALTGVVGMLVLMSRREGGAAFWLLAAPAGVAMIQFVLLAKDKPPEYARFALVVDALLLVAAFGGIALLRAARLRVTLGVATTALTLFFGVPYIAAFVRDSGPVTSRLRAAEDIAVLTRTSGIARIVLDAEPAPYSAPPINLFRNRLVLEPRGTRLASEAAKRVVVAVDASKSSAPISWADVRFSISAIRSITPATVSSPLGIESSSHRAIESLNSIVNVSMTQ
ncbi:MAG: glycosyltransferase family 39 protein [Tepidisphaeraceae bacterium]